MPHPSTTPPTPWKRQLQEAITSPLKAFEALGWAPPVGLDLNDVTRRFSLRIPRYYLDLIDPTDPKDPIALQCLPALGELMQSPGDIPDAVGDEEKSPVPGIVWKYPNRVIFLAANTCSMYCRFCFRKPVPTGVSLKGLRDRHHEAFAFLQANPGIEEVILSGGDPLVLDSDALGSLLGRLREIPHITTIRIHSRVPVTLPDRIDASLIEALAPHRPLWLITHFNHPRELTPQAKAACRNLIDAGVTVLNQAVLLKGINDSPEVLRALFQGLYAWGVGPYYLHHCDRTPGTASFRTSLKEGWALYRQLRGRLSGPALPTYVLDIPGGHGKVPINGDYVEDLGAGRYAIRTQHGERVVYDDP